MIVAQRKGASKPIGRYRDVSAPIDVRRLTANGLIGPRLVMVDWPVRKAALGSRYG